MGRAVWAVPRTHCVFALLAQSMGAMDGSHLIVKKLPRLQYPMPTVHVPNAYSTYPMHPATQTHSEREGRGRPRAVYRLWGVLAYEDMNVHLLGPT